MTDKARELLEAALDHLHGMNSYEDCLLKNRIRAYLAEQKQYDALADRYVEGVTDGLEKCREYMDAQVWVAKELLSIREPEVKQDDEPVATLDHNGNFELLRMVGVTVGQPINLYTYPASRKPFVRLTDEELIKLGSEHVGPMSDGEFHLMVITQNALEEKNK